MNLESLNALFQWGSVGLIAVTFFIGAGALVTGNRINERQTERLVSLETELAATRTTLAAQQERAARAEAELLEMRSRITPRHLTADQRDQLVARLSTRPKGIADVVCPSNDGEACVFAEELQAVLNDSGWTTTYTQAVLVRVPVGVQLQQPNEGDATLSMGALYAALRAFGVDTSGAFDPAIAQGRIEVLVGRKP